MLPSFFRNKSSKLNQIISPFFFFLILLELFLSLLLFKVSIKLSFQRYLFQMYQVEYMQEGTYDTFFVIFWYISAKISSKNTQKGAIQRQMM